MAQEILDCILPHPSAEPNLTALSILINSLSPDQLEDLEKYGYTREDLVKLNNMHVKRYEEDLMKHDEYRMHKLLLLYVPPVLIILGTIGNILSFLVLIRPSMRRVSTYNYLAVLSITDTLVLYIGLLRMWIGELTGYDLQDQSDWACKIVTVFSYTVSDYSVWLIIAVTVERYVAVVWPLNAPSMCNRRRAVRVVLGILILLFWINAHFFWTTSIQNEEIGDEIVPECDGSDGYKKLVVDIWPWVDAIIYSFLPFVVILILNSMIIRRVLLAKKERNQMAGSREGSGRVGNDIGKKLTIMLLTISFAFLITTLPMNAMLIATAFVSRKNDKTLYKFVLIRTVTELLMYVNHSMNFFLYCATGRKFRQQLCLLLCPPRIVGRRAFSEWITDHSHVATTVMKGPTSNKQHTTSTGANRLPASPYQAKTINYQPIGTRAK